MKKSLETILTQAVRHGGRRADEKIKEKLDQLGQSSKTERTRVFWQEVRQALYGAPDEDEEQGDDE